MSFRNQKSSILAALILLIVAVGYLDYLNGFRITLFPLYLIPLAYVAWKERLPAAMGTAGVASIPIALKYFIYEPTFIYPTYRYWDGAIKITLLLLFGYGIHRMRRLFEEKEAVNESLKKALSEIQELREMIPICAWCHSIRNDQGFYERIEVYLTQLTGAKFSHGICPSCREKYYGDLGAPTAAPPEPEPKKRL